jgi:hypothetical protein
MEIVRYKGVSHSIYSRDLAITDFYLFGKIKEELRTMQASSEKAVAEAATGILRRLLYTELQSAFGDWVHRCGCVIIHHSECYQEELSNVSFSFSPICSWMTICKTYWKPSI